MLTIAWKKKNSSSLATRLSQSVKIDFGCIRRYGGVFHLASVLKGDGEGWLISPDDGCGNWQLMTPLRSARHAKIDGLFHFFSNRCWQRGYLYTSKTICSRPALFSTNNSYSFWQLYHFPTRFMSTFFITLVMNRSAAQSNICRVTGRRGAGCSSHNRRLVLRKRTVINLMWPIMTSG